MIVGMCTASQCVVVILVIASLSSCASQNHQEQKSAHDPFERVNRGIHYFNGGVDHWLLKPIAKAYRWVTPNFVENGVSNFFSNLGDPLVALNQLLQGKPGKAASDTGRFLVNSTLGIAGLFDVASSMGLSKHEEDFGQTFGVWGVPNGPYIVIPFLGPSTPRDGVGEVIGSYGFAPHYIDDISTRNITYALWIIDKRAQLLSAEGFLSGDHYLFMRDAYLQRRDYLTNDGLIADEFLDE